MNYFSKFSLSFLLCIWAHAVFALDVPTPEQATQAIRVRMQESIDKEKQALPQVHLMATESVKMQQQVARAIAEEQIKNLETIVASYYVVNVSDCAADSQSIISCSVRVRLNVKGEEMEDSTSVRFVLQDDNWQALLPESNPAS